MRIRSSAYSAASALVLSVAAWAAAPPPPPPPPAPPAADPSKTEGRFKNIQVLKGQPADDLVPAMQFISASLGVDCDFCHVEHAPEKDDKEEKQTARKMMAMTMAINQQNFDGHRRVTCVSCHHGSMHPASVPEVASADAKPAPPAAPKPADLPAGGAAVDKYVQALGGADAMAKVGSHAQKGKILGFGPDPVPVDISAKAPDKRISVVHNQRGDNITAVNGGSGWLGNTGRPPRDMSPSESEAARLDAALLFP